MSRVPPRSALSCALLAAAGLLAACSGGDSFGDADEWLKVACGESAETTDEFEPEPELEDFDGGPHEQLACETEHGDLVQALQFGADPHRELSDSGIEWESGDGSVVEFAVKKLDDDQWVAVFVHRASADSTRDDGSLLAPLEDEGFEVDNND